MLFTFLSSPINKNMDMSSKIAPTIKKAIKLLAPRSMTEFPNGVVNIVETTMGTIIDFL